ncbi:MAG: hypothetical protein KGQ38_02020, partial [Actinomycetales bacterium]|nr:hypothetical protein [Actinomycetales bacterium]
MSISGSAKLRLLLAIVLFGTVTLAPVHGAELAKFKTIYSDNVTGSFALTGNTNQTCSTVLGEGQDSCAAARNFQGSLGQLNNEAHVMRDVELPVGAVDRSLIFNASANEISIPRNSQVIKAFLFWFGTLEIPASADFGVAPEDDSKADQVIFAGPGQDCLPVSECVVSGTQETESLGVGISGYYASVADVTNRVLSQQSGWQTSGTAQSAKYTVANVQAAQGKGTSAGWSLIVVYANAGEPLQHIELQSGLALIAPR